MLLLPRKLSPGDCVSVTAELTDLNSYRFMVSLLTEYREVACQLEAVCHPGSRDELYVRPARPGAGDGSVGLPSSHLIVESTFTVNFKVGYDNDMDIEIGEASLLDNKLEMVHNLQDVRYVTVEGNILKVKKLEFLFA